MENKITSIIMSLVMIGIIAVTALFGVMIFEEIQGEIQEVETVSQEETTKIKVKEPLVSEGTESEENIEIPNILEKVTSEEIGTNETEEINYNVEIDKYFYNQLDEYSKTIYKAFEQNNEEMKTGIKQIDFGNTFSDILAKENGQEILGEYYQSAIEAYMYDNPDVFYLNPNKMYLNIETTTSVLKKTYNVFINNGTATNYLADGFNNKSDVEQVLTQVQQVKNEFIAKKTSDTYSNIKMIHDYLVDNIEYDSTISKSNIYNIYGALINKECVCEGYAKSMKYLLDALDIECVLIVGTATNSEDKTEDHAWNYVKIDNKWYAIDATWDDPVIIGGGKLTKEYKYKYFLKGSTEFNKNHTANGQFTENGKIFTYPSLSISDY